MLRWLALAACAAMGCLPPPHDLVGLACDGDHPCGPGLACVQEVCIPEGCGAPDGGLADGGTPCLK